MVQIPLPRGYESRKSLADRMRERKREPRALRHGLDRVEILELEPRGASGGEVAGNHALTVQLEDTAFGEAAADRIRKYPKLCV